MQVLQIPTPVTSPQSAFERLQQFLNERREARVPVDDMETFERPLHAIFAAVEAEATGQEPARPDIDALVIDIDGVPHRQVLPRMRTPTPGRLEARTARACGPGARTRARMRIPSSNVGERWSAWRSGGAGFRNRDLAGWRGRSAWFEWRSRCA